MTNRYEIFAEWRHRYAPGVTDNTEHVFSLCLPETLSRDTIAAGEHLAWRWLPWQEAAAACFSWTNRDAILALPQHLAPVSDRYRFATSLSVAGALEIPSPNPDIFSEASIPLGP
jgi:hypothetical protein